MLTEVTVAPASTKEIDVVVKLLISVVVLRMICWLVIEIVITLVSVEGSRVMVDAFGMIVLRITSEVVTVEGGRVMLLYTVS